MSVDTSLQTSLKDHLTEAVTAAAQRVLMFVDYVHIQGRLTFEVDGKEVGVLINGNSYSFLSTVLLTFNLRHTLKIVSK